MNVVGWVKGGTGKSTDSVLVVNSWMYPTVMQSKNRGALARASFLFGIEIFV